MNWVYDRNVKTHLILRGARIVSPIPQKLHTIPADVLPNDSEDLLQFSEKLWLLCDKILYRKWRLLFLFDF